VADDYVPGNGGKRTSTLLTDERQQCLHTPMTNTQHAAPVERHYTSGRRFWTVECGTCLIVLNSGHHYGEGDLHHAEKLAAIHDELWHHPDCTGEVYAVNPEAPEEGMDIRHERVCPIHDEDRHVALTTQPRRTFGFEIERNQWGPRGVLGAPEISGTGNIVLRAGEENDDNRSWHQVAHIVLTPAEAQDLLVAIRGLLGEGGG
jgi:hypothetical protein